MASELELIKKHRELEKEIEELSLDWKYAKNEDEKSDIDEKLKSIMDEKVEIERRLINLPDKSITKKKLQNVKSELREIINHLKLNKSGHAISRNQGLIIDNFIFGKIIWDINTTFNGDYGGYPVPNYYFELGSDFDHLPVKNLLIRELKELDKISIAEINYIDLKNRISGLIEQIRSLWEDENSRMVNTVKSR